MNFLRQFFSGDQSRYAGTALRVGRRTGVAEAQAIGPTARSRSSRASPGTGELQAASMTEAPNRSMVSTACVKLSPGTPTCNQVTPTAASFSSADW